MPDSISLSPMADAVAKLSSKTPVGAILKSSDWASVPAAIRERSFFSANVESVRLLSSMQDKLLKAASVLTEDAQGGEAFVDSDSFVKDIRQIADEEGIDITGKKITDIASTQRLKLIYDFNLRSAHSYARVKAGQDPDLIDMWPAYEFRRVGPRMHPREESKFIEEHWSYRWNEAFAPFEGATTSESGRMVAVKNHPGWVELSAFDTPWEPFDFGSGMGLRDVDREDAIDLGIISEDETIDPDNTPFNANLAVSLVGIAGWGIDKLIGLFGHNVESKGGMLSWLGGSIFNRAVALVDAIVNGGTGSGDPKGHPFRGNQYTASGIGKQIVKKMISQAEPASTMKGNPNALSSYWMTPDAKVIYAGDDHMAVAVSFLEPKKQKQYWSAVKKEDLGKREKLIKEAYTITESHGLVRVGIYPSGRATGPAYMWADRGATDKHINVLKDLAISKGMGLRKTAARDIDEPIVLYDPDEYKNRLLSNGGKGSGEHEGHDFRGNQYSMGGDVGLDVKVAHKGGRADEVVSLSGAYWLSPKGVFYETGTHMAFAKQHIVTKGSLKDTDDIYGDTEALTKKSGWIRVGVTREGKGKNVWFDSSFKPSGKQISVLKDAAMLVRGKLQTDAGAGMKTLYDPFANRATGLIQSTIKPVNPKIDADKVCYAAQDLFNHFLKRRTFVGKADTTNRAGVEKYILQRYRVFKESEKIKQDYLDTYFNIQPLDEETISANVASKDVSPPARMRLEAIQRGVGAVRRIVGPMEANGELDMSNTRSFTRKSYMVFGSEANEGTACHEMGHAIENGNPKIKELALSFLSHRTTGGKSVMLRAFTGNKAFDVNERAIPDKFFDAYVGKEYKTDGSEVMSMGFQQLVNDPLQFARDDPEHFKLIVQAINIIRRKDVKT